MEALLEAAASGESARVATAIAGGAPVNCRDADGRTALHLATSSGHVDTVAVLLDRGADANAKREEDSRTPLHIAAEDGSDIRSAAGRRDRSRCAAPQLAQPTTPPTVLASCCALYSPSQAKAHHHTFPSPPLHVPPNAPHLLSSPAHTPAGT